MKKHLRSTILVLCCGFSYCFVTAQNVKPKKPVVTVVNKPVAKTTVVEKSNPFSKGTWNFINTSNISYTNYSTFPELGKTTTFTFAINPKYFIANHIAIGIDARVSSTKITSSPPTKFNSYSALLNLTYGTTISKKLNVYVTIAAGPGGGKSVIPTNTLTTKNFDYNFSAGVPILLQQDGFCYFTPYVRYDRYKATAGTHDIKDKGFNIGLKLETYFDAARWKQNAKNKIDLSKGKYDVGSSFFDYNTASGFSVYIRNENQGTIMFAPVKRKNFSLGAGYYYYFINNVAGGLNLTLNRFETDNPGSAADIQKVFILQPSVIVNVPSATALHNLFLQAGYGFGSNNYTGLKKKATNISLRAGYNLFFAKNLCITPRIGYENDKLVTNGGSSNGSINRNSGLAAEVGIRTFLDGVWKRK